TMVLYVVIYLFYIVGSSARVALSLCSITASAGVATFRFIQRYLLIANQFLVVVKFERYNFCIFFFIYRYVAKQRRRLRDIETAETPQHAASVAVLRIIDLTV
ncbi:hypothetical protein QMA09_11155, partial [Planococcus sp. APC 3906]|uniref:hypothetical protein n=1 Tax=Planococcus sp. APC 3906 TaxID=3035194 RepID=UPI0025B2869B